MLIIDRSVITDGGAALLNSGDPINITSVKTGSGTYTSSEDIKSRTALKSTQYSYTPSSVSVDGATRSIDALLSNYDPATETAIVTSDYTLTEVGLFATVNGADVLFAIGVSYDGSEVPAFTGQNKSEIIVNWDMAVSGTDAITITATGAPALAADLNNHVGSEVLSADGVHGIRSILDGENYNLQVKVNGNWVNASGSKSAASITPSESDVTITGTTGDTATVTLTVVGDGALSATSGDDSIATASLSGTTLTITATGNGSTTITVSMPETSQYTAAETTINVTCDVFVIGSTYKLGSGAHTGGTADAKATVLAVDTTNNTAIMASNGLYGGTWAGTGELTSAKNTYFGDLADAISGVYLPRGNADGSETTTTPTDIFVYNGSSFVNTYSSEALSVLAGISAVRSNYSSETVNYGGCLGTPYSDIRVWFISGSGGFSNQTYATYTFVNAPTFILDLTKVKLHGDLIVDINAANPPTKVSFASATPAQREAIVRAYEAGIIDITEYWSDGEEATATLPAIAASGTGWSVGESQPQQEVTLVLSLDNCKELVNIEDNGQKHTKFLYHQKNGMEVLDYINSTATNTGSWEGCARRGWCNNGFKAAMIQAFGDIFHELKNVTAQTYNGSTNQTSNDYFALPAVKEIQGGTASTAGTDTGNSNLTEFNALKQFKYYETSANRVKKQGNSGTAFFYFDRSPAITYSGIAFCSRNAGGNYTDGNGAADKLIITTFSGV